MNGILASAWIFSATTTRVTDSDVNDLFFMYYNKESRETPHHRASETWENMTRSAAASDSGAASTAAHTVAQAEGLICY
jgi:hypothetical protein